ncbi:NACHT domain-containing protein [Streptomyces sp. NPDC047043]|uniref:NACHT domain-containing protein n=1 Tax=Streptomyces sp. NPDC047043 TaxID=3154497 RepID=UPI0033D34B1B
MGGLFVGIASLLVALVDFYRQDPSEPDPIAYADDLARTLKGQWLEEAEARRLRDPGVLSLTWATTTRPVADAPRGVGGRVMRVHLGGRLQGRFDAVTSELAAGYDQLPQRRLVVIGEPGAGKTVLAILLTLGLLDARQPRGQVPVVLPVSTWDPVRERLDDWIVRTLAVPYYNGRPEIPRALLTQGLLLPVLDGLDEIPESARRGAIRGINHAIGGERPIVVTCRATEYEDLIRGGAPTLRWAPVVEVSPVPAEDVIAYLQDVDWPPTTDWTPVFAHLRRDPDGLLAGALSTPLMVTSARLVYQRGGDPGELLVEERFDCRFAVEEHLTSGLIDAAYAPDPGLPEGQAPQTGWTADQARRWLTLLARHLHDERERDLAWWRMNARLLPRWAGPVTGIAIGALLVCASLIWITVSQNIASYDKGTAIIGSLCVGGAFALFNSIVWYASTARAPGRLSLTLHGSAGRLLRGFRSGAALSALSVTPLIIGLTVVRVFSPQTPVYGTPRATELYAEGAGLVLALSVVAGLALAAHSWLDAPPSRAAQVSPLNSLSQDRRSALAGAFTASLVVAVTGLAGWYTGLLAGDLLYRELTGWQGWPGKGNVSLLAGHQWDQTTGKFSNRLSLIGVAALLPGMFFGLLVLMARAWPHFLLTRIYLAARGRLPWRLMAFLADARKRELLRQSGGTYQFRHIRLQEALAGEPVYGEVQRATEPASATIRRRAVLAVGGAVAVAAVVGARGSYRDESEAVFATPGEVPVYTAVFGSEGRRIACGAEDGSVWIWNGRGKRGSGDLLIPRQSGYAPPDLVFHPGTGHLVVSNESGVAVWDVDDRTWSTILTGNKVDASKTDLVVLFSREGEYLVGLSYGFYVWQVQGDRYTQVAHPRDVAQKQIINSMVAVDFLHDGSLAVLDDANRVWQYTPPSFAKQPRLLLDAGPEADIIDASCPDIVAAHAQDSLMVLGHDARLWRRTPAGPWRRSRGPGIPGDVCTVRFHPTRPLVAAVGEQAQDILLWSIEQSTPDKLATLRGHNDVIATADFSTDGHRLVTASGDGTVRVWNLVPFGI